MDSALNLLKEEINQTLESEHDLAKWKLGVTAALGAAAFGLAKEGTANYWLLLLVPFVCAYIDLYAYQYQFRILVIARFLRERADEDAVLQRYERECARLRRLNVFSLGNRAGFASSLGASLLGPLLYFLKRWQDGAGCLDFQPPVLVAGGLWLVGVVFVVRLWQRFKHEARNISGENDNSTAAKTA